MNVSFGANAVSVVLLNATTLSNSVEGSLQAGTVGYAALLVFNTTDAVITAGTVNDLSADGLGANAGLQIIGLEGQDGVDYGGITADDFNFAFVA